MVSRNDQRDRVVALLAAGLLAHGLAETSLRQMATVAGVSDRMLLYYFKDKSELLTAVLSRIAADMAVQLAEAIPENAALAPRDLLARAIAVTQAKAMRPSMRLWVEIVAAAARGEEPYQAVSAQIAQGFLGWIEARLDGPACDAKRATAAAILAMVDGLALINMCMDEAQSRQTAEALCSLSFPAS